MAELLNNSNRQLIPRWHTSRKLELLAPKYNPLEQLKGNLDDYHVQEKLNIWRDTKSVSDGIELFTALELANDNSDMYKEVKGFLLSEKPKLPRAVIETLEPRLRKIDTSETYTSEKHRLFSIINTLKSHVREFPYDSLTWCDLAFYYSILGEKEKASKAMTISYHLSNSHPTITRAFARMLIHLDDPEQALSVIKQTGMSNSNPELMSAEVAIRSTFDLGKPNISQAKKLVDRLNGKSNFLSELSASIGTIELQHGSVKRARSYLNYSTVSPTENTIAQLKWISQKLDYKTELSNGLILKSIEAEAIAHYQNQNYAGCRVALLELHDFQPFSKMALADFGYISLVAMDEPGYLIDKYNYYEHAVRNNFLALNNYVVALLEEKASVNFDDLFSRLKYLVENEHDQAVMNATLGMYLYGVDKEELGETLYKKTAQYFRARRDNTSLALLLIHHAISMSGTDENKEKAIELLKQAKYFAEKEKKSRPEVLDKVGREIKKLEKTTIN